MDVLAVRESVSEEYAKALQVLKDMDVDWEVAIGMARQFVRRHAPLCVLVGDAGVLAHVQSVGRSVVDRHKDIFQIKEGCIDEGVVEIVYRSGGAIDFEQVVEVNVVDSRVMVEQQQPERATVHVR